MSNSTEVDTLNNTMVGCFYMVLVTVLVIPYLICLKLFITDEIFTSNVCYRIMFHMGLADMGQMIFHFIAGPLTIFQCATPNPTINKILGGLINGIWMSVIPLTTLLAVNRFVTLCQPHLVDVIFTQERTTIIIGCLWVYGSIYLISYMTPYVGVVYYDSLYTWGYDTQYPYSKAVSRIEFWTILAEMLLTAMLYAVVVASFHRLRAMINNQEQQALQLRRELRLAVQALLIFCYSTLALMMWHTYEYWLPDDKWTYMVINCVWIGLCGINPIIYLTFNKTVRGKAKEMLGLGVAVVSVAPTANKSPNTQPMVTNHT